MRKWELLISVAFLGVFLSSNFAYATDFSSSNFVIKDPVINLGSVLMSSGSFVVNSSLGEEALGISASQSLGLKSGFLYFPSPTVTSTSTPASQQHSTVNGSRKFKAISAACDFNKDNFCDITDLSIFLYWVSKPYSLARKFDVNQDGQLDIADISIIFYYWSR